MAIEIGSAEWHARREEMLRRIKRAIGKDGWIITGVFDPDSNGEGFLYTLGFTTQGKPELLMTEIPAESISFAEYFLTQLGERHEETAFTAGQIAQVDVDDTLFTAEFQAAGADDNDHYLGTGIAIYGDQIQVLKVEPAEHLKLEEN